MTKQKITKFYCDNTSHLIRLEISLKCNVVMVNKSYQIAMEGWMRSSPRQIEIKHWRNSKNFISVGLCRKENKMMQIQGSTKLVICSCSINCDTFTYIYCTTNISFKFQCNNLMKKQSRRVRFCISFFRWLFICPLKLLDRLHKLI